MVEWLCDWKLEVIFKEEGGVFCYWIDWQVMVGMEIVLMDCWDIGEVYWYGGFEDYYQLWFLEKRFKNLMVFVFYDLY